MSVVLPGTSGNYVNAGSGTSLDDLTVFTFILVAQPTSLPGVGKGLVGKGTSGANSRRSLELDSSSRLRVIIDGTTIADDLSTSAITTDWQFLATTWDEARRGVGPAPELYRGVYGTSFAEVAVMPSSGGAGTGSGPSSNAALNQYIGAYGGASGEMPLRLAFAGIWNRELSLGELRDQFYQAHVSPGCSLFLPFGGNGASSQPDFSGNRNTGTITGGTLDGRMPPGFRVWRRRRGFIGWTPWQYLRPDATITSTGWTAIGAASHHAAQSDALDTTYSRSPDPPVPGSPLELSIADGVTPNTGDITVRVRIAAT